MRKSLFLISPLLLLSLLLLSACAANNDAIHSSSKIIETHLPQAVQDASLNESSNNHSSLSEDGEHLETSIIEKVDENDNAVSSNISKKSFGIEEVGFEQLSNNPDKWFKEVKSRGISMVGIDVLDIGSAETGFDSPTLKAAGFTLTSNAMPKIFKSAKENDIKVIIMLESIAHVISDFLPHSDKIIKAKLSPANVKSLIHELAAESKKDGIKISIDEEAFDDDAYLNAISSAAKEDNIEYIHFFEDLKCRADVYLSEDYAYYPYDAANNDEDNAYIKSINKMGTYYGEIGNLNLMYAAARGCDKKSAVLTAGEWGLGPKTHQNIALMRAIQYNPVSFFFVTAEGDEGVISEDENSYVGNYNFNEELYPLIKRFVIDEKKPVANLIIDPPKDAESDFADFFNNAQLSSMSAITNALLSSGYSIVATESVPYKNADLYYVFTSGGIYNGEESYDLSDELASLPDMGKPVIYQAAEEIPDTPNWSKILNALGITRTTPIVNYESSGVDPIPETVRFKFPNGNYEVKYRGYTFEPWDVENLGRSSIAHTINLISPEDVSGTVLLEGKVLSNVLSDEEHLGDITALIIKNGNIYLVNGGYLHLDASSILANIISKIVSKEEIYNQPSYGYLTTGQRTVFFAPYTKDIDINIKPSASRSVITEFDENGNVIDTDLTLNNGRLKGKVKKFHLVVV